MALNLEKRADGTYYFRRTQIKEGKQKAQRISLKTKSFKTAKILAIKILAGVEMDKLLQDLLSNTRDLKRLEVEYDGNQKLKKLVVKDEADKQIFLEIHNKLEEHRQAEHVRNLELINLQTKIATPLNSVLPDTSHSASIENLYQDYIDNLMITLDAKSKYKRVIGDFVSYCTNNKIQNLSQINRKVAFAYLRYMRATGKDDKTNKNYLGVLSTFWNFLRQSGETEELSPFSGHKLDVDEDEKSREPFSNQELELIFASDFVTKNVQNKFILLLLLTTGARPNEICQLWKDDIFQITDKSSDQPEWAIRITKNLKRGQTLKTKSSNRLIYLNDLLIQKGFLDFHSTKSSGMLFDLTKPTTKNWSVFFSERFSEEIKGNLKIKNKSLYCFRHTTNNRLKNNFVAEEIRENLLGHKPTGTNSSDYSAPHNPSNLKKLTENHLFFDEIKSIKNLT